MYSSALTTNSRTFVDNVCDRSTYYYEAIQINVNESGRYSVSSSSTYRIYGHVYKNSFDPFDLSHNRYLENGDEINDIQFKFITNLLIDTVYILVVSINDSNVGTNFSIIVSGPKSVRFSRIGEYHYNSVTN